MGFEEGGGLLIGLRLCEGADGINQGASGFYGLGCIF
jgi:hypothetical protein